MSLLRSEGDLREARHEAERKSREVLSLQEELQKEEETKSNALREKRRLKAYIRQLSQELEELRSKHQVTGNNQSEDHHFHSLSLCGFRQSGLSETYHYKL